MAFLNLLLAEALAAGLANRAESEEPQKPPPPNFFVLPSDPQAWRKFHEACVKENLVIAVEVTDNSKANCRRVPELCRYQEAAQHSILAGKLGSMY